MLRTRDLALVLLVVACKGRDKGDHSAGAPPASTGDFERAAGSAAPMGGSKNDEQGGAGTAFALEEGKMGKRRQVATTEDKPEAPSPEPMVDAKKAPKKEANEKTALDANQQGQEAVTRAWFPETFLFEPLVVTDAKGEATVPVHVPDRLTTWRVLALAHSRTGAQGGATTSFLGTLPAYVDPVIPAFLMTGDKIRLPIQMINTTEAAIASTLETKAEHAVITGGNGAKTVPAQGSLVEYAELTATTAGTIKLGVRLGGTDAVVRTIDVAPSGKPITVTRAGTLAAPRELTIVGPAGSDPDTDHVRLLVFPGALALLRSELSVSTARAGIAEDSYALLLAGKAPALLASLGDKPDVEALRTLSITTAQRAIRHGRTLDVTSATLVAEAALAHPDNPVLARLGERAVGFLAQHQRPDGTFSGATGWTLQRVLVATADGTRAASANLATANARQRAKAVQTKAAGAFARTAEQVSDPYTAAAILASGAASGELATTLQKRVLDGLKVSDDGAKYLEVKDVVRADGSVPSRAEQTALAVLALETVKDAPLADLGTTLLGAYSPVWGWGDGTANLACMRAVLALFKNPLPAQVAISLKMDGKEIASGTFNAAQLKDVLALDGPAGGFSGSHAWSISAEPAVPGLGYSLALQAWVPWEKQTTQGGLELQLPAKLDASVGKATEIALVAIAPSNLPVHIRQALPAGVQADRPSLEALVSSGQLQRFELADGKVDMYLTPLQPGQTFTAKYKVIPTLAGTLRSGASVIESGTTSYFVPPTQWVIK
ncbi:MAG: alpha-2-macroglobulin family protein [Kofleriaceae bacterium]